MTVEELVRYFIEASISGASKTQVVRRFKELYSLNDDQISKLEILAKFKNKPKKLIIKIFIKIILQRKLKEFITLLRNFIKKRIFYRIKNVIN